MRSKTAGRVLAAVLALGMFFATTAGVCAEELTIEGVGSETLTENEIEAYVTDAASFDESASEDGVITDDEFVFADSADDYCEPAADEESADEDSFYEDEAEDPIAEGIFSEEEPSAEGETVPDILEEESQDALLEEFPEDAVPEYIPEVSEEVTSEPFGMSELMDEADLRNTAPCTGTPISTLEPDSYGGKYGELLASGITFYVPVMKSYDVKKEKGFMYLQNKDRIKSYKIKEAKPVNKGDKVATVSGKGIVTPKKAGECIIVCYDKAKKPVGYIPIRVNVTSGKKIVSKVTNSEIWRHLYTTQYDGHIDDCGPGDGSYPGSFKSSISKVLSINDKCELTAKKNGKATVTIDMGAGGLGIPIGTDEPMSYNMKFTLKFTVKTPSVKGSVKVKPGKSYTVTVKNACADNKVAGWDFPGQTVTHTESGDYNQKCKITTDLNGGITGVKAVMDSGEVLECFIVCSQTKKRIYTDNRYYSTVETSYDTKSLKKVTKAINDYRKKNGLKTLKTNTTANVVADVYARISDNRYRPENIVPILRKSGDSVADIIKGLNEGDVGKWSENGQDNMAKATKLGVSIYVVPEESGTKYLLVVYGVVPTE